MSGLKRMSKQVLLMEPTALHAFRTTSRLLASAVSKIQAEGCSQSTTGGLTSTIRRVGETRSGAASTEEENQTDLQSPRYYLFTQNDHLHFSPLTLKNPKFKSYN